MSGDAAAKQLQWTSCRPLEPQHHHLHPSGQGLPILLHQLSAPLHQDLEWLYYPMPKNVSWLGRSVISSLLAYDPAHRVPAHVILHHPWFERHSFSPHPWVTRGWPCLREPVMFPPHPWVTRRCPGYRGPLGPCGRPSFALHNYALRNCRLQNCALRN